MKEPKKVVGNFGYTGWSTSPEDIIKTVLVNYHAANFDQTVLFKGNVHSMAHTFNKANHDPELLTNLMQDDLSALYSHTLKNGASVKVTHEESDNGTYEVFIAVNATVDGKRYDLHTILKTNGVDIFNEYEKTYYDFKQ